MSWTNLTQQQAVLIAAAVGGGAAILGGTVAALVTQLLGASIQRRRVWNETRHVAYARVAETFHAVWALYDDAGRARVDPAAVRRAGDDLFTAYSRAALLTRRSATSAALEELHDAAQPLWDRAGRVWTEVDNACRDAEWTFRREARLDLGLSGQRGMPKRPVPSAPAAAGEPTGAEEAGQTAGPLAPVDEP